MNSPYREGSGEVLPIDLLAESRAQERKNDRERYKTIRANLAAYLQDVPYLKEQIALKLATRKGEIYEQLQAAMVNDKNGEDFVVPREEVENTILEIFCKRFGYDRKNIDEYLLRKRNEGAVRISEVQEIEQIIEDLIDELYRTDDSKNYLIEHVDRRDVLGVNHPEVSLIGIQELTRWDQIFETFFVQEAVRLELQGTGALPKEISVDDMRQAFFSQEKAEKIATAIKERVYISLYGPVSIFWLARLPRVYETRTYGNYEFFKRVEELSKLETIALLLLSLYASSIIPEKYKTLALISSLVAFIPTLLVLLAINEKILSGFERYKLVRNQPQGVQEISGQTYEALKLFFQAAGHHYVLCKQENDSDINSEKMKIYIELARKAAWNLNTRKETPLPGGNDIDANLRLMYEERYDSIQSPQLEKPKIRIEEFEEDTDAAEDPIASGYNVSSKKIYRGE